MKQTKSTRKKARRQKLHRFELKTPNAGNVLDVAEDHIINKAVARATGGGK